MSPFLKWTLAVVAGGGAAGAVQTVTVAARSVSTAATGGLANWIVATAENVGAAVVSALAILLPIAAIAAIVATVALLGWRIIRRRAAATATAP
jgi:cellobiose-specific phosphotransferase system component IIC